MSSFKTTIFLASGSTVEFIERTADLDEDEYLGQIQEDLTGDGRPGWRQIGDTVLFSQAISAVQVESL